MSAYSLIDITLCMASSQQGIFYPLINRPGVFVAALQTELSAD